VGASFERIVRAGWPVLVGVVVGLGAGAIWTLAQPERHRAEARVLLRGAAASRVVPAVEALAESSLLRQNVAQTLHLSHPPDVSATRREGGILTLSVEAGSRERARQIDAEAALVLTQLVAARFGDTRVKATVLDPAHPVEQTSPTPGRNLLIAGLIGFAAGLATALALARRRAIPLAAGAIDPSIERRLKARVDAVAKRERALARQAGELAKREKQLERRAEDLTAAAARPSPAAPPEPVPAPEPEPAVLAASGAGGWNVNELERAVAAHADAAPETLEEWRTYLFFLREHALTDGSLPSQFDSLVEDVFADVTR
jgi:hypothetical protein